VRSSKPGLRDNFFRADQASLSGYAGGQNVSSPCTDPAIVTFCVESQTYARRFWSEHWDSARKHKAMPAFHFLGRTTRVQDPSKVVGNLRYFWPYAR